MGLRIAADAARDLDWVHDGVRRLLVIVGGPLVCALMAVWELLSPSEAGRVAGVALWAGLGTFALLGLSQTAPRSGTEEVATQGDGCVLIPVRRARETLIRSVLASTPVVSLVVLVTVHERAAGRAGVLLILSVVLACTYLPARLRNDLRLRLSPTGLRFLCGDLRQRQVLWEEIEDVLPDPGRGRLFILLRGGRVVNLPVLRYPWRASAIGATILHFARHPQARAALTNVRALDPILEPARRSPC